MPVPIYDISVFAKAFSDNLPTGLAWPKEDPNSNLSKTVLALAGSYWRAANRAANLIKEYPATTLELLPEWEASVGLPDPCLGEAPSVAQRRAQVVARFGGVQYNGGAAAGSLSIPALQAFAKSLGFGIAVAEFAPFRAGLSKADLNQAAGIEHGYDLVIQAPLYTSTLFKAGVDGAGEKLGTFGNLVLECELRHRVGAEVRLTFQYLAAAGQ